MKIRHSPQARDDLHDIFHYLNERTIRGQERDARDLCQYRVSGGKPAGIAGNGCCGDTCKNRASLQFQDILQA